MNHDYICPVEATLEIVGGKYKPLILWHLSGKTLRFGQLQKLLSSATPKMLTKQLRELENDGLIARKVYPVVPPKWNIHLRRSEQVLFLYYQAFAIGEIII